jgi:hypothetical protein
MVDWKTIAIILIIAVIIESIFIVYIIWVSYDYAVNEARCSATCVDKGYMAYNYDFYTKYCYCFDRDGNKFLVEVK